MPNASIAVLREEALSASRLVALRKITSLPAACRSNGSLEGEQPRAPGARVTAPAAVAAAAAVADADIALAARVHAVDQLLAAALQPVGLRSEEHTSELQSLMRISYAVFCLKKKNKQNRVNTDCQ